MRAGRTKRSSPKSMRCKQQTFQSSTIRMPLPRSTTSTLSLHRVCATARAAPHPLRTPPITRLGGQTPLLLPPAGTSAAPARTDASRVHAAHGANAKRAKRATPPPHTARPAQRAKHVAVVGESWIVPASLYPRERCDELGGLGWRVTICQVRPFAVQVSFDNACSESGQRFEIVCWLQLAELRRLAD
eukprot:4574817-Pleurochrysis_carterae.AAC.1